MTPPIQRTTGVRSLGTAYEGVRCGCERYSLSIHLHGERMRIHRVDVLERGRSAPVETHTAGTYGGSNSDPYLSLLDCRTDPSWTLDMLCACGVYELSSTHRRRTIATIFGYYVFFGGGERYHLIEENHRHEICYRWDNREMINKWVARSDT